MWNVTGTPTAGKDAHRVVDTMPVLEEIQSEVRGDDALANMPRKFNVSVSGVPDGSAQDAINDIGLEPAERVVDGDPVTGFNVRVGGGLGGHEPRVARPRDVFVTPERAVELVRGFVEPVETDYEDPYLYDAKRSWYPFDDGESPASTAPDGTPLSADD
jgi:ferredoxin-nitrite reductase